MPAAVGIDLGTTYSLVASIGPAGLTVYPAVTGNRSTASVVLLSDPIVVGEEAKRSAPVYPDRTFAFFKRDMGKDDVARTVDGDQWTPVDLSAEVLRSLKGDVQRATGEPAERAVVTVPAYFGDAARRATIEAAEHAGLQVLELIHEPTAAALAFGFGGRSAIGETIMVYDLGGGTFDVTLVRNEDGAMTVVATDGDHELGGKDWDDALMTIVADEFSRRHGVDPRWDPVTIAELRERCEDAKRALSRTPETTVAVTLDGIADRIVVSRDQFEESTTSLLAATERTLEYVLSDASLGWQNVSATILVGGSTRMPACGRLIERVSGLAPRMGVDPDAAVVNGAALLAARSEELAGLSRPGTRSLASLPRVQDVTAHALGFVVVNAAGDRYVNDVMIARNTGIPAVVTRSKLLPGGADELDVYLLQGHASRPLDTESLGRYRFMSVPGGGHDRDVEIAFMYDDDGIVRIRALVDGTELNAPEHEPGDKDLSWTDEDPRDHSRSSVGVILAMDCSGSMAGTKLEEAKESCVDFATVLGELPGAQVGLVSFASGSKIEAALSEDNAPVVNAARMLSLYGGTDLTAGIDTASDLLAGHDGRRVLVIVTDGEPKNADTARAAAGAAARDGVEIVTVGVTGANQAFLQAVATADRESIFTDAEGMRGALRSIARSLAGGLTRSVG